MQILLQQQFRVLLRRQNMRPNVQYYHPIHYIDCFADAAQNDFVGNCSILIFQSYVSYTYALML